VNEHPLTPYTSTTGTVLRCGLCGQVAVCWPWSQVKALLCVRCLAVVVPVYWVAGEDDRWHVVRLPALWAPTACRTKLYPVRLQRQFHGTDSYHWTIASTRKPDRRVCCTTCLEVNLL
jgi:hypothetical protein